MFEKEASLKVKIKQTITNPRKLEKEWPKEKVHAEFGHEWETMGVEKKGTRRNEHLESSHEKDEKNAS